MLSDGKKKSKQKDKTLSCVFKSPWIQKRSEGFTTCQVVLIQQKIFRTWLSSETLSRRRAKQTQNGRFLFGLGVGEGRCLFYGSPLSVLTPLVSCDLIKHFCMKVEVSLIDLRRLWRHKAWITNFFLKLCNKTVLKPYLKLNRKILSWKDKVFVKKRKALK